MAASLKHVLILKEVSGLNRLIDRTHLDKSLEILSLGKGDDFSNLQEHRQEHKKVEG